MANGVALKFADVSKDGRVESVSNDGVTVGGIVL